MVAITQQLAERILSLTYAELPEKAIHWAKIGLLDTLGVTVAGAIEPCTSKALAVQGIADAAGPSVIIGQGRRTSILDAAFINGIAAHAIDYDDVNNQIGGHPSVPLVPALFAIGDSAPISGESAIAAYVVGFETETQVGLGVNHFHYAKGWHPTATIGIFGTVAVGARLLALSVEQTAQAMAIAVSLASGVKANFGTMTKPLHIGQSVRNGVMAVLMAKDGFTANDSAFEHMQGFLEVFNGPHNYNIKRIFSNWGAPWNVIEPGPSLKVYPCCGSTHGAIECALALREKHVFDPLEITSVQVYTDPKRLPHTNNPNPKTDLAAKFSVQYVVARALIDGEVKLDHFEEEAIQQPLIRQLMAKVKVGTHPDMQDPNIDTYAAEVRLMMNDGQNFIHRSDDIVLRGPGRPMNEEELFQKFNDCAKRLLKPESLQYLFDMIRNFENLSSINIITDELIGI